MGLLLHKYSGKNFPRLLLKLHQRYRDSVLLVGKEYIYKPEGDATLHPEELKKHEAWTNENYAHMKKDDDEKGRIVSAEQVQVSGVEARDKVMTSSEEISG